MEAPSAHQSEDL